MTLKLPSTTNLEIPFTNDKESFSRWKNSSNYVNPLLFNFNFFYHKIRSNSRRNTRKICLTRNHIKLDIFPFVVKLALLDSEIWITTSPFSVRNDQIVPRQPFHDKGARGGRRTVCIYRGTWRKSTCPALTVHVDYERIQSARGCVTVRKWKQSGLPR